MDSASLLGAAESMKRQPIFLLEPISPLTNWRLYLSDPLPSFGFAMPSALGFFFIIGQLGELSHKSCWKKTTWKAFIYVSVDLCVTLSHKELFLITFPVKPKKCHISDTALVNAKVEQRYRRREELKLLFFHAETQQDAHERNGNDFNLWYHLHHFM